MIGMDRQLSWFKMVIFVKERSGLGVCDIENVLHLSMFNPLNSLHLFHSEPPSDFNEKFAVAVDDDKYSFFSTLVNTPVYLFTC